LIIRYITQASIFEAVKVFSSVRIDPDSLYTEWALVILSGVNSGLNIA
jgi:hypothetical protein